MCGIFLYLSHKNLSFNPNILEHIYESFEKIKDRGPNQSYFETIKPYTVIGFHRLAVMDINKGMQPFVHKSLNETIYLICNGEIYNYKQLVISESLDMKTNSDCEVILHLYLRYGMEKTLELLDGEYAIIILRISNISGSVNIDIARDPYGVRPVFMGCDRKGIVIASEIKAIRDLSKKFKPFPPGTHLNIHKEGVSLQKNYRRFFEYPSKSLKMKNYKHSQIENVLIEAVRKRLASDRPLACLLSGGLDSSIIAAIASKILKEQGKKLHTFTIGFKGSSDIEYSKKVADYICSDHTVYEITPEEALESISNTIYSIESYDTTTVRASIFQYILGKKISENTDFKVLLTGEGSDEVASGYIYNYYAPNGEELHKECLRRLKEIYLYDGLRVDRSMSAHGLEVRIPFLDPKFVAMYLSLDPVLRTPTSSRMEKTFLRIAFYGYLPDEVLWRRKEAFSDGVSESKELRWFNVLQNYINKLISDDEFEREKSKLKRNIPTTKEQLYYRKIWEEYYGKSFKNKLIVPHFWMPRWIKVDDPSATVLSVY